MDKRKFKWITRSAPLALMFAKNVNMMAYHSLVDSLFSQIQSQQLQLSEMAIIQGLLAGPELNGDVSYFTITNNSLNSLSV